MVSFLLLGYVYRSYNAIEKPLWYETAIYGLHLAGLSLALIPEVVMEFTLLTQGIQ